MVGNAVAIIVESRFCMNIAVATINAVSRVRCVTRLGSRTIGTTWAPSLIWLLCGRRRSEERFGQRSDLRVTRTARIHAASLGFFDPAEFLQDLLTVGHPPVDFFSGFAGQQQGGARHQDRGLEIGR